MVVPVLAEVEQRRRRSGAELDPDRRDLLGQFFTPPDVAMFIADLVEVTDRPVRLLDPGAGVGSLTAAVVDRWGRHGGGDIVATLVEADENLLGALVDTTRDLAKAHSFVGEVVGGDFIEWGSNWLTGFGVLDAPKFDLVIMNPPYRKIHSESAERGLLSAAGIEAPNLYAGFVALAAELLDDGGQLVAIIPRSFANGPYFRRFRKRLLEVIGLDRIHVFDARHLAFSDTGVLQENVIISGRRGVASRGVVVSSSRSALHDVTSRRVNYDEVVRPDDAESFVHIAVDDAAAEVARRILGMPFRLVDLGIEVSTGPVVDFRQRDYLRSEPGPDTVPLVYPLHLRAGRVLWPKIGGRKANAIVRCEATQRLLFPASTYVVVKRFTSKEERRRIVASLVDPVDLPGPMFAFENHVNVFHAGGSGLSTELARGLVAYLNTTAVDSFFRQFNGHTQVNATDLRSLRYPSGEELADLGALVEPGADQEKVDEMAAVAVVSLR